MQVKIYAFNSLMLFVLSFTFLYGSQKEERVTLKAKFVKGVPTKEWESKIFKDIVAKNIGKRKLRIELNDSDTILKKNEIKRVEKPNKISKKASLKSKKRFKKRRNLKNRSTIKKKINKKS